MAVPMENGEGITMESVDEVEGGADVVIEEVNATRMILHSPTEILYFQVVMDSPRPLLLQHLHDCLSARRSITYPKI